MKFILKENQNYNYPNSEMDKIEDVIKIERDSYLSFILFLKVLIACTYAFGLGYSLFYYQDNYIYTGFIFLALLIVIYFIIELPHELLHALFFPKLFTKENVVIEFNIRKFNFSTYSNKPISKLRILFILLVPLIVLTIIPTIISYNMEFNIYLYAIASANAIISGTDIVYFLLILLKTSYSSKILVTPKEYLAYDLSRITKDEREIIKNEIINKDSKNIANNKSKSCDIKDL